MRLHQNYTGRSQYYPLHEQVDEEERKHRSVVAVVCEIGEIGKLPVSVHALLDIGAEWSMLPPAIAKRLGYQQRIDPKFGYMSTRHGDCYGHIERGRVCLPADEGDGLPFEVSWFISENWTGQVVLGWRGGLEHIRFALDPTPNNEHFYFGKF